MDQMLQHYSSEGWLTYHEPAASLSRQASVRVRPPVLTPSRSGSLAALSTDDWSTWQCAWLR